MLVAVRNGQLVMSAPVRDVVEDIYSSGSDAADLFDLTVTPVEQVHRLSSACASLVRRRECPERHAARQRPVAPNLASGP